MAIAIHVSNELIAEAMYQLLVTNGYDAIVMSGRSPANGCTPDVLLADSVVLRQDLLSRYPDAKVLLMDTGLGEEKLIATLLSYRVHGVLSPDAGIHFLKAALTAIKEGKLWIDNKAVKALLGDAGDISKNGKFSGTTDREKQIIACICQGLSNKEIARKFGLSEHTVRSHLHNIFRKFHVTSRSRLMSLTMDGRPERSV